MIPAIWQAAAAAAEAERNRQAAAAARAAEIAAAEKDRQDRERGKGRYQPAPSPAYPPAPPSPPPPPPPPPAPPLPKFVAMAAPDKNIKTAGSDIIVFDDDSIEITLIQDLLFEDIGATELANISRIDLIDGQDVMYSPIKNLPTIRREFNPNNIIATSYSMDYFSRFGIDIIPRGINEPYFDDNGSLVIEIDSVAEDEEIQVQILASGTIDIVEEI